MNPDASENPQLRKGYVMIDARGYRCPVPTLKLRRQLEQLETPGVILLANDPMAQIDVPHFCNQNNYLLISTEAVDEGWIFTVSPIP